MFVLDILPFLSYSLEDKLQEVKMLALRRFTEDERRLIEKKVSQKTLPTRVYQRYQIIWLRSQGIPPGDICRFYQVHPHTVRSWVRRFNEEGFARFEERSEVGGRPPQIDSDTRTKIIQTALSRPKDLGQPFTQWSLMKLKEYLETQGIISSISPEGIRKILRAKGISYQSTKTWMESPDPDFEVKKTS